MPFIQTSGTTKVSKHVQMTETQDKVVRSCKVICSFGCGVLAGLVVLWMLWQVHPQPPSLASKKSLHFWHGGSEETADVSGTPRWCRTTRRWTPRWHWVPRVHSQNPIDLHRSSRWHSGLTNGLSMSVKSQHPGSQQQIQQFRT